MLDPDNRTSNVPSSGAPNVAYPGYFLIDRQGIVRERFLDASYDDRRTASGVIGALFPALLPRETRAVEAPHVGLALSQSDREVVPGSRMTLIAELTLPPGVHVYAHDASGGYRPIELALEPSPAWDLSPAQYPPSRRLRIEVLGEEIPVHEGAVQIRQEVHLLARQELLRLLQASGDHRTKVGVKGVLRYQACDERECFPPCEIPVSWEFVVHELDLERTDPSLRKPAR